MLLSDAYKIYTQDKILMGYSRKTLKAYGLQINMLIKHIGNMPITNVDLAMLRAYLSKQTHLKPASLGHRVRFIRSFFRWALDEGLVQRNPAAKLREPKIGVRVPKFINEEDMELLFSACKTPMENALLRLLYSSGCRIGEIYGLNKNEIDWNRNAVVVHGKGDKEREVYFNTACKVWLRKYLESREDDCEALFVTQRKPHRRTSIAQLRYIIKRIAKNSEVKNNIYPHKCRHSFSMHLLNNGAPLEIIQSLLGHSRLETTKIYAQLSGEMRRSHYKRYF